MRQPSSKPALHNSIALWLLILFGIGIVIILTVPQSSSDRAVAFRTIALGLSASLIAIPIGSLIAWICSGRGFFARTMLITTVALLLVPMFIHVSSWDAAFGKLGWLTATKGQVLVPLISGWNAAAWIHGIAAAPQVALILLIGMRTGNRVFEEQALLDTTPAGVFWHVTFKRIWPLLILSIFWIVISCAREIAVTDIYQVGTLAEQIYLGYSLGINAVGGNWSPSELAQAGALNPQLTIAVIIWTGLAALFLFMKLTSLERNSDQVLPPGSTQSGFLKSLASILILAILVLVPFSNVVIRACFFVQPVDGVPTQGYSVEQMFSSIRKSVVDYQDEFVWSFLIGITSATLIILIATLFAYLARRSKVAQLIFAISLAVTCALPGPYIGTFLAKCFSNLESESFLHYIYNYTIAAPVLANLIFCWPAGALIVWFVFRKIPNDALESSSLDGAGGATRFIRFGIAGNKTALIGCWLLSFAFCFGELSASHIVRPAGMDTVPRKMLGDLHAGVNELTAGITIVTAFTVVVISLAGWMFIRLNHPADSRK